MVPYPAALDLPHALVEWVSMLIVTREVTAAASSRRTSVPCSRRSSWPRSLPSLTPARWSGALRILRRLQPLRSQCPGTRHRQKAAEQAARSPRYDRLGWRVGPVRRGGSRAEGVSGALILDGEGLAKAVRRQVRDGLTADRIHTFRWITSAAVVGEVIHRGP